ncbi:hypothetical protein BXA16_12070 [Salmonella enterica subsp. enterica serovar Typhimurium]|nr:hypothetical protein BXA16_12070 [Salmonella enterica subsp. enterica serovar Typhimurium]
MRLFAQLSWYFRREWRRYLGAVALLMLIAMLQLIPPKVVGIVVDGVTAQQFTPGRIAMWIGTIALIAVVVYLLRYIWRVLLFGASYQLAVELREDYYRQLSRQHPEFYQRHRTGDLIARATNDVDRVVFAAGEGVLTLVDSLVMGCAVLIVMSTQISWQLTLLALLPMPIMVLMIKRYGDRLHDYFKLAQAAFSSLNDRTQESLTSIRMIKAFGLEDRQSSLFAADAEDTGKKNMRVARIDARFDPTIYIAIGMANLLAISGGSWMVVNGSLTLGELTSFMMYLGLMIWPMLALAWMFNIVERGSAAYSRIRAMLAEAPVVKDGEEPVPAGRGELTAAIREFCYPQTTHPALENVNFRLKPGQMLGICGPTGAGKSTILSLIQRHFDVTQGEIRFHDMPLTHLQLDSWRSRLAVVSQTPFLFSDSIANNIALGRPEATQEEIEQVARLASVHEDILRLPQGYDTQVGERGVMLSGGQKQRISIARALLLNAEILLLDDALSAVDGRTEHQILHNLRQWGEGRTVIISAHRLSALTDANEIIVMQHELWPTLKRLLAYGSPWRKPLSVAVMMLWIAAAAEVSGPLLISYFIDNMVARHHLPLGKVAGLAAAYVGLQFLAAGLHYAQSLLFNRAAVGVVQSLRTDVMDAALRQPLSAFDTQPVGQLISRVTNDTEVIRDLYVTVVATVLRSAALIGAMLVAMFSLDWRMALVAILIFPAVLTVMIIYQRYSTPIVRRVRAYLADINDGFNEIINGMSVIQQFRQQARFGERMGEASRSHYMARMQTLRLDGFLLRPLLSLFSALILCGLLMLFSFTSAGTIEVGVLYAFISYLSRLNEPLIELTTQQSMLQQAVVAGERVFELMDRPRQRYGSDDRPLQSGAIDIDHLSFAYRDDNLVLQDITLSVPSRSFVALVGHTGSGKSTLASLLMGYYPLTQGEIRLDGREIASLNHRVLRQGVAMVQQDPVVMADTFLANVTLGRDVSEAQVWQALETVQLADLARGLSDGLHTHLGEQGNTLSVGQKQLLALARVLVDAPQILILDEATASIDSGTEQAIQQALAAIRERTTLVVIAHRLSTIVEADTILVLHRGQAVERGTHQQLLAAQGRYWQMYQLQLVGEELAASVHEEPGPAA